MREKIKNEPGENQLFASLGKLNLKTWLGIFLLIASVALFSACAPTGDDAEPTTPDVTQPEPVEPVVPEPVPATALEVAQMDASDAMDAAMTASDMAKAAAEAAAMAGANLASIQTGDAGYNKYLDAANTAYDDAMEAYNTAKMESDAAQAATDVATAIRAAIKAEIAQADAETAQQAAEDARDKAMMAANDLLKIDDTVKSVGDSMVDATTGNYIVTANGQTTETGLIDEPMTAGATTNGRAPMDGSLTDASIYKSPMVNAASRGTIKIGKELDTSNDAARLLLITHHTGTNTVRVYDEQASGATTNLHTYTGSDGKTYYAIGASAPTGTDPGATGQYDAEASLKSEGMFYRAESDPVVAGLQPLGLDTSGADPVQAGDTVSATAKPVMVYSYKNTAGHKVYVVENTRTVTGGVTTVTYQSVQTRVAVNRDGDTDTGVLEPEATAAGVASGGWTAGDELVQVTAKLPVRSAYDHVHFGVWASLGDAAKNGAQVPDELGIGFVQSIGDGMTGSDMPNNGDATYSGNWAATIQESDSEGDGAIRLTTGPASVSADFGKETITATLTDLATLTGDITGNTFSGDKATATGGGLDVEGTFNGSFSGGFFGTKAEETGGVFNFTSDGNKDGAFSGAFGGQRN